MEWPAKEDLRPAPVSYEALEGYPGVFICVEVRFGGPGAIRSQLAGSYSSIDRKLSRPESALLGILSHQEIVAFSLVVMLVFVWAG